MDTRSARKNPQYLKIMNRKHPRDENKESNSNEMDTQHNSKRPNKIIPQCNFSVK
jgi:hypothetical protein